MMGRNKGQKPPKPPRQAASYSTFSVLLFGVLAAAIPSVLWYSDDISYTAQRLGIAVGYVIGAAVAFKLLLIALKRNKASGPGEHAMWYVVSALSVLFGAVLAPLWFLSWLVAYLPAVVPAMGVAAVMMVILAKGRPSMTTLPVPAPRAEERSEPRQVKATTQVAPATAQVSRPASSPTPPAYATRPAGHQTQDLGGRPTADASQPLPGRFGILGGVGEPV